MFKKISLLIIIILLILSLSSCVYLKERILNGEPLYGGGNIKNIDKINIIKDIGLNTYVDNNKNIENISVVSSSLPSFYPKFTYSIFDNDGNHTNSIKQEVYFTNAFDYSKLEGITTFRGNNYRNSSSYAYPIIKYKKLNIIWQFNTSNIDKFKGLGWTGQPAIVNWPIETQKMMNMYHSYKYSNGTIEAIVGSLDGHIYFIDLYTGKQTREPINLDLPIFGSVTVDPRGYPLLYVGTGFNKNGQRYEDMTFSIINLITGKIIYKINGSDDIAARSWGAFDSSPLIDVKNDTLIIGGENGLIYNVKLNTNFDKENATISVNPTIKKYYYTNPFGKNVGFESSLAAFKNYMYISDNGGLLQCIDTQSLTPVWLYNLNDDSDSTISLDVIDNTTAYLYSATELLYEKDISFAYIHKINALTGKLMWETKYKCKYLEDTTTGITSTPIVGTSDISNYIIYTITGLGENGMNSSIVALDKESGSILWQNSDLPYTVSSPTAIYDSNGKAYIVMGYSDGTLDLLDGKTGVSLFKIKLDGNIESTPAIYNGMIVIGTRNGTIYNIKIS